MQIKFASVMVEDQDKALQFYTQVLGFTKQTDLLMGEYRFLTVASPDGVEGAELMLEPVGFPPSRIYQKARFDAGIPAAAFISNDIATDCRRLKERDVRFRGEPQNMGPITAVLFEDGCGNLINLVQPTT
jgi:catechol 2,3-dioxygenase-like lactoylglutathione lyase family enzyme